MSFQITIVTSDNAVPDRQALLARTLDMMVSNDPLCLTALRLSVVVCGTHDRWYDWIGERFPAAQIYALSSDEWAELEPLDTERRVCRTTMRALRISSKLICPTVFLQDDLSFAQQWLEKTLQAVRDIRARHNDEFVLALYAPYELKSAESYVEYASRLFYGNQALYLPAKTCSALAAFMESTWDSGEMLPDDMMVKKFLLSDPYPPLFSVFPNVVQHVGTKSTVGSKFHTSPTFVSGA